MANIKSSSNIWNHAYTLFFFLFLKKKKKVIPLQVRKNRNKTSFGRSGLMMEDSLGTQKHKLSWKAVNDWEWCYVILVGWSNFLENSTTKRKRRYFNPNKATEQLHSQKRLLWFPWTELSEFVGEMNGLLV